MCAINVPELCFRKGTPSTVVNGLWEVAQLHLEAMQMLKDPDRS